MSIQVRFEVWPLSHWISTTVMQRCPLISRVPHNSCSLTKERPPRLLVLCPQQTSPTQAKSQNSNTHSHTSYPDWPQPLYSLSHTHTHTPYTHFHIPNLIKLLSHSPPCATIKGSPAPLISHTLIKYITETPFIIMQMPLGNPGGCTRNFQGMGGMLRGVS